MDRGHRSRERRPRRRRAGHARGDERRDRDGARPDDERVQLLRHAADLSGRDGRARPRGRDGRDRERPRRRRGLRRVHARPRRQLHAARHGAPARLGAAVGLRRSGRARPRALHEPRPRQLFVDGRPDPLQRRVHDRHHPRVRDERARARRHGRTGRPRPRQPRRRGQLPRVHDHEPRPHRRRQHALGDREHRPLRDHPALAGGRRAAAGAVGGRAVPRDRPPVRSGALQRRRLRAAPRDARDLGTPLRQHARQVQLPPRHRQDRRVPAGRWTELRRLVLRMRGRIQPARRRPRRRRLAADAACRVCGAQLRGMLRSVHRQLHPVRKRRRGRCGRGTSAARAAAVVPRGEARGRDRGQDPRERRRGGGGRVRRRRGSRGAPRRHPRFRGREARGVDPGGAARFAERARRGREGRRVRRARGQGQGCREEDARRQAARRPRRRVQGLLLPAEPGGGGGRTARTVRAGWRRGRSRRRRGSLRQPVHGARRGRRDP